MKYCKRITIVIFFLFVNGIKALAFDPENKRIAIAYEGAEKECDFQRGCLGSGKRVIPCCFFATKYESYVKHYCNFNISSEHYEAPDEETTKSSIYQNAGISFSDNDKMYKRKYYVDIICYVSRQLIKRLTVVGACDNLMFGSIFLVVQNVNFTQLWDLRSYTDCTFLNAPRIISSFIDENNNIFSIINSKTPYIQKTSITNGVFEKTFICELSPMYDYSNVFFATAAEFEGVTTFVLLSKDGKYEIFDVTGDISNISKNKIAVSKGVGDFFDSVDIKPIIKCAVFTGDIGVGIFTDSDEKMYLCNFITGKCSSFLRTGSLESLESSESSESLGNITTSMALRNDAQELFFGYENNKFSVVPEIYQYILESY